MPEVLEPDETVLADRSERLFAALFDDLLNVLVLMPGLLLFLRAEEGSFGETVAEVVTVGSWLTFNGYQWWLTTTTGQSLGKRWRNIRVVMSDGSPITFGDVVVRRVWSMWIVTLVPVVGALIYYVLDPLYVFTPERRCLHDRIAGTDVIQNPY